MIENVQLAAVPRAVCLSVAAAGNDILVHDNGWGLGSHGGQFGAHTHYPSLPIREINDEGIGLDEKADLEA
jgi:hypothetical protein